MPPAVIVSASIAAVGEGPRGHGDRATGCRVHAATATASFVFYILGRLADGRLRDGLLGHRGRHACGWAWLAARPCSIRRPGMRAWARVVGLILALSGALSILAPAGSVVGRVADNTYALSGSTALLLTFGRTLPSLHARPAGRRKAVPAGLRRGLRRAGGGLGHRTAHRRRRTRRGPARRHGQERLRRRGPGRPGAGGAVPPGPPAGDADRRPRAAHPPRTTRAWPSAFGGCWPRRPSTAGPSSRSAKSPRGWASPSTGSPSASARRWAFRTSTAGSTTTGSRGPSGCWPTPMNDGRSWRSPSPAAFASLGPFNRAFRDEVGTTPRAYRATTRAGAD